MNSVTTQDRPPRSDVTLYAVAFGSMIIAAALVAVAARDFLQNTGLLWVSTGLSLAAIILAVLAARRPTPR